MKCLLKYQWVKLPRNQMPAGKGIMGTWARLASRAAVRNGQARYCRYVNQVTIGSWAGGIVGLKSILGIKNRNKALEMMDKLVQLGYIDYELNPKTKNGEMMYNIIFQTFLTPEKLTHTEILYRLSISDRHYYRLRQQAVNILSIRLWTAPAGCLDAWLELLTLLEGD